MGCTTSTPTLTKHLPPRPAASERKKDEATPGRFAAPPSPAAAAPTTAAAPRPCPARRVVLEAAASGPRDGWRDGWLTLGSGVMEPDPGASRALLCRTPGRAWVDASGQLPALVSSLTVRLRVRGLPVVPACEGSGLPDGALIAADACLATLAHAFKWEWSEANPRGEWALEILPRPVLEPWREVCRRLGMRDVGISVPGLFLGRHRVVDRAVWCEDRPFAAVVENVRFEPELFGSREERVFMGCLVETAAAVSAHIGAFVDAQQAVQDDDPHALLRALLGVWRCADSMTHALHKISTSKSAGAFYCDPIVWGRTIGPVYSPINPAANSPGGSGLYHPAFHVMDAFFGRTYASLLGAEARHVRSWFPPNWRRFVAAFEDPALRVADYVDRVERRRKAGDPSLPSLRRAYDQALEAYTGERGWLGAHRHKAYGFLQIVAKAGRASTNGGAADGRGDAAEPWEEVHEQLRLSRAERTDRRPPAEDGPPPGPGVRARSSRVADERDGAGMCPYMARIAARDPISDDPARRTQRVTLRIPGGLSWNPGDRLMTLVPNDEAEVAGTAAALNRGLDDAVELDDEWAQWLSLAGRTLDLDVVPGEPVPLHSMLRFSVLRPVTYREARLLRVGLGASASSDSRLDLILQECTEWPQPYTLASLIRDTVPAGVALQLSDGDLCRILCPQRLKTYSISNACPLACPALGAGAAANADENCAAEVHLTVARQDFNKCTLPTDTEPTTKSERYGRSSSFLSRSPSMPSDGSDIMIGLQSPINFRLPCPARPVVMVCAGSGIAPFRSFWQAREQQPGTQTWLLFGCQTEDSILYRTEMDSLVRRGVDFRPYVAFSREPDKCSAFSRAAGLTVRERPGAGRGAHVADMLLGDEALCCDVIDLLLPLERGGRGGNFYLCGNPPFYEGFMKVLREVLASHNLDAAAVVDTAFSQRRFMVEVFGPGKACATRGKVAENSETADIIWQSELANANAGEHGAGNWFAVSGSVYDATKFAHMHPGGKRIIEDASGTDATVAFCLVAHDTNSEVMGAMQSLCIGKLQEINGSVFASTDHCHHSVAPVMDAARLMLYKIVGLQNVFENDFSSILESGVDVANTIQEISPLSVFCSRFLQALHLDQGCIGCEAAWDLCRHACVALKREPPPTSYDFLHSEVQNDLMMYLTFVHNLQYELEGIANIPFKIASQSQLDHKVMGEIIMFFGKQALKTIECVKQEMIMVVKLLEGVFSAALEGSKLGDDLITALEVCTELPGRLGKHIASGSSKVAAVMANPPSRASAVTHANILTPKAATLTELSVLAMKAVPADLRIEYNNNDNNNAVITTGGTGMDMEDIVKEKGEREEKAKETSMKKNTQRAIMLEHIDRGSSWNLLPASEIDVEEIETEKGEKEEKEEKKEETSMATNTQRAIMLRHIDRGSSWSLLSALEMGTDEIETEKEKKEEKDEKTSTTKNIQRAIMLKHIDRSSSWSLLPAAKMDKEIEFENEKKEKLEEPSLKTVQRSIMLKHIDRGSSKSLLPAERMDSIEEIETGKQEKAIMLKHIDRGSSWNLRPDAETDTKEIETEKEEKKEKDDATLLAKNIDRAIILKHIDRSSSWSLTSAERMDSTEEIENREAVK